MKKIMRFLEEHVVPIAAKMGGQKHLSAIRDGFVAIMPLIILCSFAILLNGFPWKPLPNLLDKIFGVSAEGAGYWKNFGGYIWTGTFAIMSPLVCFATSYSLAKSYEVDGLGAGITALAALMMLYATANGGFPLDYLGASGLFVALIVALLVTQLFVKLMKSPKLLIKMPEGVPPAVARSFAALFPVMITLSVVSLVNCILVTLGVTNVHELVFKVIQRPLQGAAQGLGWAVLLAFVIHLLWFFGLHGPNILLAITNPLYMPALEENVKAFGNGVSNFNVPNIIVPQFFDAFVYMGGSGTTIGLLLAIYIASRKKKSALMEQYKGVANLALAPGIFNINEPVVFGMPIVLNPVLAIPFIITPIVLVLVTYFAMSTGLVPKVVAAPPWTFPPIISGLTAVASWRGAVLSIINLAISIVIYLPFVLVGHDKEVVVDKGISG